jgi:photosynthetic reaction center cytochrome c subunit
MSNGRAKGIRLAGVVSAVLAGAIGLYAAWQAPMDGKAPKMAEEQFKNIQVLKGTPADQVIPTMQFISASLGVECEFCHVEHAFDKDDKKPKQFARNMMRMTMAINKDNFEGHLEVSCNTCHRGSSKPVSIPAIADENFKPPMEVPAGEKPAALPSANDVVGKYVAAVGGKAAIGKLQSLSEKGSMTAGGKQIPIEIYTKAAGKRASIAHMPNGESITAVDGHAGWLGSPGRPARDMNSAETDGYKLDATFALVPNLEQIFKELRVIQPEKLGDRETNVVLGIREGMPPVKMNFDKETGLLVRMTRYTETPFGRNPVQVDFADYRELAGAKIPYKWTLGRPSGRFTIQVDQAQANVSMDDAKFVKPAAPPGAPQGGPGH